jgi:hypothetical protein
LEIIRYKALWKKYFQASIPKNRFSTTTRDTARRGPGRLSHLCLREFRGDGDSAADVPQFVCEIRSVRFTVDRGVKARWVFLREGINLANIRL